MANIGNTFTQQGFTPAVDYFSGNASTTAFTLSRQVASVAQVEAFIENVPQNPSTAFTVSGNTITFTSAPPIGTNNIYIRYTSPITQVIAPGQGTVGTNQLVGGTVNTTADIGANGLTVGKGGGSVSTNTVVGSGAFSANSTGAFSVAVGYLAAPANTSGEVTAVGAFALQSNNTGNQNTAFGVGAAGSNTTGSYNVAVGRSALTSNTTASNNTAVGYQAGYSGTTSAGNSLLGYQAGYSLTTGSPYNVAVGYQAGYNITTGASNVCIGVTSGTGGTPLTTGTGNILIGDTARTTSANAQYQIAIGYNLSAGGDNYVNIGKNGALIYARFDTSATWTQASDARLKTNIQDDNLGLEFISKLRPVTYNWKPSNEVPEELTNYYNEKNQKNTETLIHGMIAQEVKQAMDEVGVTSFNGWDEQNDGTQSLSYEMFIMPLIKSIQELKALVDAQAAEIAQLKTKVGV